MRNYVKAIATVAVAAAAMMMVPSAADAAAVPTNFKQTDADTSSVKFKWDAVVNADDYIVSWTEDLVTWSTAKQTYGDPDELITGLSSGKSYYVKVASVDENGTSWNTEDDIYSAWSEPFEVVTAPDATEVKPVTFPSIMSTSITGTWNPATGATSYVIKDGDTLLGEVTGTTCTVGGLTPNTWYHYNLYPVRTSASGYVASRNYISNFVKTANGDSTSVPSDPSVVTTAPGKPSTANFNLGSYSGSSGYASFRATDPAGKASGYEVQVFKVKGGKKVKTITSTTTTTSTYRFAKNTPFKYRIRYYTISNGQKLYGKYSGYRYFTLHKISGKRTYNWSSSNCKIKMKWGKVKGAKNYSVYISKRSNGGFKKVKTLGKNKTSITMTKMGKKNLSRFTKYYIKVVANVKVGKKTVKNDAQSIQQTL